MTDDQVIKNLLGGNEKTRKETILFLKNTSYGAVLKLISSNNGTIDDTQDIFQEGLLILYQNIILKKFRGESKISTYLYSICKNLWSGRLRKRKKEAEVIENLEDQTSTQYLKIDSILLQDLFDKLGENCKMILTQFYYDKKSMKEIMEHFALGSVQAAKNKKSRCLKSLMQIVKSNNLTVDRFIK